MVAAAILACTLALVRGPAVDPSAVTEGIAFRVRAIDPRAQEWIRAGTTASPTFRSLVSRLGQSDLIVYVEIVDRIVGGAGGQMYFVTATGTARYVRIEVVMDGDFAEMVALVGHELQHAVEVADAPRVRDRETLEMLYLGMRDNSISRTSYDSAAARVTQERVRSELAGFRAPGASAGVQTLARLGRWK